jgi:hypothetical protein
MEVLKKEKAESEKKNGLLLAQIVDMEKKSAATIQDTVSKYNSILQEMEKKNASMMETERKNEENRKKEAERHVSALQDKASQLIEAQKRESDFITKIQKLESDLCCSLDEVISLKRELQARLEGESTMKKQLDTSETANNSLKR